MTEEEKLQIEALLIACFEKWGETVGTEGIPSTDLFRKRSGCKKNSPYDFMYMGFRAGFDQGIQFAEGAAK